MISINEGTEKPYCLKDRNFEEHPYIRKGASDRLMKSTEIEKIYRDKDNDPALLGWKPF